MRRLLTVLLLGVAVTALPVPAAQAHNILVGSDPAKGATLSTAPTEVTLTFDQPVRVEFAKMALTDAAGTHYESGKVTADDKDVTIAVRALTAPGQYTIGYQILSNDGHPVTGGVTFTYAPGGTASATPTAPATPAPPADSPAPVPASAAQAPPTGGSWVWGLLIGMAALLALATYVLHRHDRRLRGTTA
ncbi:copper resistance CopC family protein [Acrocarpospora catenulata]|uniref:copper resistance CopC family protein n=1 Tax=Acrocarpospora catenulata TaxID=2836182 RepID=UPI001BD9ECD0|nr:copper resistance CopC family protein [Acrocarpospora catenulata]